MSAPRSFEDPPHCLPRHEKVTGCKQPKPVGDKIDLLASALRTLQAQRCNAIDGYFCGVDLRDGDSHPICLESASGALPGTHHASELSADAALISVCGSEREHE